MYIIIKGEEVERMKKTRWWQHVPVLLRSSREPECSSDHSSAGWAIQPYKAQVVANSETVSSPVIGRYRGEKEEKEDIIIIYYYHNYYYYCERGKWEGKTMSFLS